MLWTLISAVVGYWLGKQEEQDQVAANSPGARAARAAGASPFAPPNAINPQGPVDLTGDVKTSNVTP